METYITDCHRKRALEAFCKAIQEVEIRLTPAPPCESIEKAKAMMDLAEFHILAHDVLKAEAIFREALNIFYHYADDNLEVCSVYIVYILKTISGIYECLGRKSEAKTELTNAMKWEVYQK